jgi:hypothetical protein
MNLIELKTTLIKKWLKFLKWANGEQISLIVTPIVEYDLML